MLPLVIAVSVSLGLLTFIALCSAFTVTELRSASANLMAFSDRVARDVEELRALYVSTGLRTGAWAPSADDFSPTEANIGGIRRG